MAEGEEEERSIDERKSETPGEDVSVSNSLKGSFGLTIPEKPVNIRMLLLQKYMEDENQQQPAEANIRKDGKPVGDDDDGSSRSIAT